MSPDSNNNNDAAMPNANQNNVQQQHGNEAQAPQPVQECAERSPTPRAVPMVEAPSSMQMSNPILYSLLMSETQSASARPPNAAVVNPISIGEPHVSSSEQRSQHIAEKVDSTIEDSVSSSSSPTLFDFVRNERSDEMYDPEATDTEDETVDPEATDTEDETGDPEATDTENETDELMDVDVEPKAL